MNQKQKSRVAKTEQSNKKLKLYSKHAAWFPLLSPPSHYREEADFFVKTFMRQCQPKPKNVLELGSGGGHNASHMKKYFTLTLVDLSPEMLKVSVKLNPECTHIQGDMRTVRLKREFDAVFVHDAVCYMTSEPDLRQAMKSAYLHCRTGGAVIFAPDNVKETFKETTKHGGASKKEAAIRYLEWVYDPDPDDTECIMEFAYLLREGKDRVSVEHDRHRCGLFSRTIWLRLLRDVGFDVENIVDDWDRDIFIGRKR